jgi:hypothetical protein
MSGLPVVVLISLGRLQNQRDRRQAGGQFHREEEAGSDLHDAHEGRQEFSRAATTVAVTKLG